MVIVPNATIRHNGLLVDNTTKLTVYLPELTTEQDTEILTHTKFHEAAIIILDPAMVEDLRNLLEEVSHIRALPASTEPIEEEIPQEEWTENSDSGFASR